MIRSHDEPVEKMAKLLALLFSTMAEEMMQSMGKEEGTAAVRRAVTTFGKTRATSMLQEAKERQLPINLETYFKVRDMPSISWEKDPDQPQDVIYCPMHAMWQEIGNERIGRLYCEIDEILFEAFGAKLNRPLCLTYGDDRCRFLSEPQES